MSNLLKNLLIALTLIALAGAGYFFFFANSNDGEVVSVGSDAAVETQEIIARIRVLDGIRIDGDILSDRRFTSLLDFRQTLIPEPVGRENPFAPVE